MAPSEIQSLTHHDDTPTKVKLGRSTTGPSSDFDFGIFRRLVPLVADQNITHLNAAFLPASNLIVQEAINQFCWEGLHQLSPKAKWKDMVEETRSLVARYINVSPSSLAFTRDTTEAMGSFMKSLLFRPGDNVVILDCEHPNQAYGWLSLRRAGLEVRQVPTDAMLKDGPQAANASTFEPFVDDRTRVIGLSSIMFHNGQWNDVADICARFRPRGIHVLADLTQQVGFANVDVKSLGISAAAFSLHKGLSCPSGIGVLFVDEEVLQLEDPVPPIVSYGGLAVSSEDYLVPSSPINFHATTRRFEHANMSFIGIAAANASLHFYLDVMGPRNVEQHLFSLSDELRRGCEARNIDVLGPKTRIEQSPHLCTLVLRDERWEGHFKTNNVAVTVFPWGVRISFGFYNNMKDVTRLFKCIDEGLCRHFTTT